MLHQQRVECDIASQAVETILEQVSMCLSVGCDRKTQGRLPCKDSGKQQGRGEKK